MKKKIDRKSYDTRPFYGTKITYKYKKPGTIHRTTLWRIKKRLERVNQPDDLSDLKPIK